MRIPIVALVSFLPLCPAMAAPRSFVATVTAASPLQAVPTGRVAASELPPPPGVAVSTRGPMIRVPDPVMTSTPRRVPLPAPHPMRATEYCLIEN